VQCLTTAGVHVLQWPMAMTAAWHSPLFLSIDGVVYHHMPLLFLSTPILSADIFLKGLSAVLQQTDVVRKPDIYNVYCFTGQAVQS